MNQEKSALLWLQRRSGYSCQKAQRSDEKVEKETEQAPLKRPKFGLPETTNKELPSKRERFSFQQPARVDSNDSKPKSLNLHSRIRAGEALERTPQIVQGAKTNPFQRARETTTNSSNSRDSRRQGEENSEPHGSERTVNGFRTARQQLIVDCKSKGVSCDAYRKEVSTSKFRLPLADCGRSQDDGGSPKDERLKNVEAKMVDLIESEIMDSGPKVEWDDVAGLEFVKTTVKEIVVFPMLRPDIFCGLRSPPKGILLFGPPGTGKTLIGKCIAAQSRSTFFSISSSSLTSKWIGDGEKMVRALFAVARVRQPSVVFIDEIDSLLSQRSDSEHESSRRIKTEFLVQLDGASTVGEERILVVGATNRPQDLDEAARRRLIKRLYVPLPDLEARIEIVRNLLTSQSHDLKDADLESVAEKTCGYSGADMASLCKEAAMGPIRSLDYSKMDEIEASDIRAIEANDFFSAIKVIKASVSAKDLERYRDWNRQFGCGK